MQEVSGVYAIRCIITERMYVGQSVDVWKRWTHHRSNLRRGTHANKWLQSSWAKHGEHAFVFSLLAQGSACELDALEEELLKGAVLTYNIAAPGNAPMRGVPATPTQLAALKRPKSAAHKAKISAAHKGKKKTAEHRANLGAAQRGVPLEKNRRILICLETGERHSGLINTAKHLGVNVSSLLRAMKASRPIKGLHFIYEEVATAKKQK